MSSISKMLAFFMSAVICAAVLASCGAEPAELVTAPNDAETVARYYDCAYGDDPRQILDLRLPENAEGETGLILYIHGGAWVSGSKEEYRDALDHTCSLGYAAAAVNYRYISPSVNMGMLMDDVTAALAKIKALAVQNDIQIDRVLLTGTSAGAHMSLLYAYKYADSAPITPVAVVSNCGPTDLCSAELIEQNQLGGRAEIVGLLSEIAGIYITESEYLNKTGGYEDWAEALREYSPLYQVSASSVPTVIGHGKLDGIVPFSSAVSLDAALTENGVTHEFVIFPNSGHELDNDPDAASQMNDLLAQYAQTYLKQ